MASRLRHFFVLWEDQHPLARTSFYLMLGGLVLWGIYYVLMWLAPALLTYEQLLFFGLFERVWFVIGSITVILIGYNALRILAKLWKKEVSRLSAMLALIAVPVLLVSLLNMPSSFQAAVRKTMERPYSEVYAAHQSLCEGWAATYGDREFVSFSIEQDTLGILQAAEVWREQKTVFFNFGDSDRAFGLACTLGEEPPNSQSVRSRHFDFFRIENNSYRFVERE